ncbi:MAG: ATP-binding cassette domain-containing protein [Propionibacteriaceae bacterium]|nr:ATP-binding cassette domain-containing protein [Propionibacteriaceae bacterium]
MLLGWAQGIALALFYIKLGSQVQLLVARDPAALSVAAIAAMALLALAAALAAWGVPFLAARGQAADEAAERDRVMAHVFKAGAAQRSRARTGAIVSTAVDGVERAAAYRGTFLGPMIGSMTAPLAVLALMAVFLDPVTAGWTALALPVIPAALGGFQAAFRGVSRRYRENGRLFAAKFLDAIQGLPTLRLLNAEQAHGRRLAAAAEELRRSVMRLLAGNQLMLFVVDSLFSLAFIAAVAGLALWRISQGAVSLGEGLALVLCGTLLLEPLDRIGQFFYIGLGGIAAAKEINALTAEPPAVPDPADLALPANSAFPVNDRPADSRREPPAVELTDVRFAYGTGPAVLTGINLSVARGEHVALTGPSGAGKTTIAELLQGNLRPDAGSVKLFGRNVEQCSLAWQRAQLAVLAQHTYLFTGTLRENLLAADPAADDQRLTEALAAADLADFITELPNGLDTAVGERGLELSGGQAQRLGLARAFLKDAPILVLDEPTAHVDLASERAILTALERLGRDKTVIAISHRQAAIANADRTVAVGR